MQIHELPEYSGDPATNDVFPIDTGTHTFKLPFAELGEAIITTVSATISGVSQTVKAAIEALQGQITALDTVQTTTATLGGKGINLRKQGKVVTVSWATITPNPAIVAEGETTYSGVIPSGWRPATQQTFWCISNASVSSGKMMQVAFQATGNVVFYNWSTTAVGPTSGWIRGSFTYVCE